MHFLNNPFFSLVLVNRWRVLNHRWSTEIPFRISLTSQMLMFNIEVLAQWLENLIYNSKVHEFYSQLRGWEFFLIFLVIDFSFQINLPDPRCRKRG